MLVFLLFARVQPTTRSKQADKSFLANSSTVISGQSEAKCHFFVLASLHATNADLSPVVASLYLKLKLRVSFGCREATTGNTSTFTGYLVKKKKKKSVIKMIFSGCLLK